MNFKRAVSTKLAVGVLVGMILSVGVPLVYSIPTIDSSLLIGTVDPGSPADAADELGRLQKLIEMYNATPQELSFTLLGPTPPGKTWVHTLMIGIDVPDPILPDATDYGSQAPVSGGMFNFDLGLGSDYTMVKWGDVAAYYWTQGKVGLVTFDNDIVFNQGNGNPLGGSHVVQFNRVPDGGATLALLGAALIGLVAFGRRLT